MNILETERLYLREMTEEDAENAYLLNLDPEVVQYTGDGPFESVEVAREFLKNYQDYKKYGMGRWAVVHKETGEYLGWCGLKYFADKNEVDVGYRLQKKYWGHGYATESATACIEYGFNKLRLTRIVGNVMKENLASIRVLEKLGMTLLKESPCGGEEGLVYEVVAKNA